MIALFPATIWSGLC